MMCSGEVPFLSNLKLICNRTGVSVYYDGDVHFHSGVVIIFEQFTLAAKLKGVYFHAAVQSTNISILLLGIIQDE